jgi:hypothetical protein
LLSSRPPAFSNDTDMPSSTILSWNFEDGIFPTPPWSTDGDGAWAIDQSQVDEGMYSIKSPDFDSEISSSARTSNATLTLGGDFIGGVLRVRVYAR